MKFKILIISLLFICIFSSTANSWFESSSQVHFDELSIIEDDPYPRHICLIFMRKNKNKLETIEIKKLIDDEFVIYYTLDNDKSPFYVQQDDLLYIMLRKDSIVSRG